MRIVIIEDQRELCNVLGKRITSLNESYKIIGKAFNGAEGLKLIQESWPDVAFIDIRMPVMNGLQMMEHLSKEEKQLTKCIVLSAYSDFPYTQQSIRSGAFDYLLKPISNQNLKKVLERVESDSVESQKNSDHETPLDQFADDQIRLMLLNKTITDELVLDVLWIIKTEYMKEITLKSLADRLHINESHLSRIFSQKVDVSLIQFINIFRINLAKTLIDHTELKIGDIAKLTGFGNNTYFGRLFRKHTSLSATEYKQKVKKELQ